MNRMMASMDVGSPVFSGPFLRMVASEAFFFSGVECPALFGMSATDGADHAQATYYLASREERPAELCDGALHASFTTGPG